MVIVEPIIAEYLDVKTEYYFSILPTSTPFARNAIFSGMFPDELASYKPEIWEGGTSDERSLNRFEDSLLMEQYRRLKIKVPGEPKYFKMERSERRGGFCQATVDIPKHTAVWNCLQLP